MHIIGYYVLIGQAEFWLANLRGKLTSRLDEAFEFPDEASARDAEKQHAHGRTTYVFALLGSE